MESAKDVNCAEMDNRYRELTQWLREDCGLSFHSLEPLAGDASFRRYFRLITPMGSHIVMDAPPPRENCRPFVAVSDLLRANKLNAPAIVAKDINRGYLLLSDFGDHTLLKTLTVHNVDTLYQLALDTLAAIQACRPQGWSLPTFGADWLWNEWAWHKEWFLDKWLNISISHQEVMLDQCYQSLVQSAIEQPQVFMHRDYHSANLMVLPDHQIGILDFQDAFIGPVTYDAVSLLRDCYINWPDNAVDGWMNDYFEHLVGCRVLSSSDRMSYYRWFDWMGVQRHVKALLTFARKQVRDHQSQYLQHVPRTLNYLLSVSSRYPELRSFHDFYRDHVLTASREVLLSCAQ